MTHLFPTRRSSDRHSRRSPMTHPPAHGHVPSRAADRLRKDCTEIELIWIEKRLEHWIRFGRIASERIVSRKTRIVSFLPDAIVAFVRWSAHDFGPVHPRTAICRAVRPGPPHP